MHKTILYILIIVIWSVDSINLNNIFKKNHPYQARVVYILIIFSLTYLTTNFIIDFVSIVN